MSGVKCRATGKVVHRNQGAAVAALRRLKNAGMSPYPCPHCGGWHVGNSRNPFKQQARIDQLLAPSPNPPL